jgi:ABC-2 type transport system ATP-binding protein
VKGAENAIVPAVLEVVGLSHNFGARRALDHAGFTIRPGEFTVLLGQNGAGKTTLFSLVTRLFGSDQGAIRVFGHDVNRRPSEALKRIGVVFQQRTLDPDLSVRQNLMYHAALHGLSRRAAKSRVAEELARIDLTDRADDKVRQLSGGQARRVEVARALMHEPRLLLLDEPTVGLDMASRQSLLEHVRRQCRDKGLAVLWATHLIDEVDDESHVIVLHQGKVLDTGVVNEVVERAGTTTIREAFAGLTGSQLNGGKAP